MGTSVILLIIGLILLVGGSFQVWRVLQRTQGVSRMYSLRRMADAQGRAWSIAGVAAVVGLILTIKGIAGL